MAQAISVTPVLAAIGPAVIIGVAAFVSATPETGTTNSIVLYTKAGDNVSLTVTEDVATILAALNA